MILRNICLLCLLPVSAAAQDMPPLLCSGNAPNWTLSIDSETAVLSFQHQSEMTIPQQNTAEGQDWPRALTLVSRNDTAIVIIDAEQCDEGNYTADVLTQRGQTPILLTGCCTATR